MKHQEHKRKASRFAVETVLKVKSVNLSTPVANGSTLYRSSRLP
jgi:hypothetical protein